MISIILRVYMFMLETLTKNLTTHDTALLYLVLGLSGFWVVKE